MRGRKSFCGDQIERWLALWGSVHLTPLENIRSSSNYKPLPILNSPLLSFSVRSAIKKISKSIVECRMNVPALKATTTLFLRDLI